MSAAGAPLLGPRHRWRVAMLARALARAAPAGEVLDAGCGPGTLARLLARGGRRTLAFDRDARRLRAARARALAAGLAGETLWWVGDVTALPLAAGAVAAAAAGEVLEHVDRDTAAAAELARVLAPGGALVVTVPAGPGRYGPADRAAGHRRRYDRAGLAALLAGAGLGVERLAGWGFPFGRLYDRWVQRPALAARGGRGGALLARAGHWRPLDGAWRALFAVDERLPAGERGSGWLAVARKGAGADAPARPAAPGG